MLPEYIQNVMMTAEYVIGEDGECYGSIPGFNGVWAHAGELEACRQALQNVLEEWLLTGGRPSRQAD